jgi:hypothetical protein
MRFFGNPIALNTCEVRMSATGRQSRKKRPRPGDRALSAYLPLFCLSPIRSRCAATRRRSKRIPAFLSEKFFAWLRHASGFSPARDGRWRPLFQTPRLRGHFRCRNGERTPAAARRYGAKKFRLRSPADIKRPGSFRSVDFMRGERHEIGAKCLRAAIEVLECLCASV